MCQINGRFVCVWYSLCIILLADKLKHQTCLALLTPYKKKLLTLNTCVCMLATFHCINLVSFDPNTDPVKKLVYAWTAIVYSWHGIAGMCVVVMP